MTTREYATVMAEAAEKSGATDAEILKAAQFILDFATAVYERQLLESVVGPHLAQRLLP